jgi:hypothetical protein
VRIESGQIVGVFRPVDIPSDFARAELRLEGLKPPAKSFEARFFADDPRAGAHTQTYQNPRFLASQFFYGLGPKASDNQSMRSEIRINITDGLRDFLTTDPGPEFTISIVAVSREGELIPKPDLDLEGFAVELS